MMEYTERNIVEGLQALGVNRDEIVFMHSSLFSLGLMEGVSCADIPAKVLGVMQEYLAAGALIMPDYRYDFSKTQREDLRISPNLMGVLPGGLFKNSEVCSSNHPMFTCLGIGKRAEEILRPEEVERNPFGPQSVFGRICEHGGMVLFFGADFRVNTMTVYVEREASIAYRQDKAFEGVLVSRKGVVFPGPFYHFCFPLVGRRGDYSRARRDLLMAGILKTHRLGRGVLQAYRALEFKKFVMSAIVKDPEYLRAQPDMDEQQSDQR